MIAAYRSPPPLRSAFPFRASELLSRWLEWKARSWGHKPECPAMEVDPRPQPFSQYFMTK